MKTTLISTNYIQSAQNQNSKLKNTPNKTFFWFFNKSFAGADVFITSNKPNISFMGKNSSKTVAELLDIIMNDRFLVSTSPSAIRFKYGKNGKRTLQRWADRTKRKMSVLDSHDAIESTHEILSKGLADEASLKSMFEYLRKQKLATKMSAIPIDIERNKHDVLWALGKFIEICENTATKIPEWVKKKYNKEINSLIDYYFKPVQVESAINSKTRTIEVYDNTKNFRLTPELRTKIKKYTKDYHGKFVCALDEITENHLSEVSRVIKSKKPFTQKEKENLLVSETFIKKMTEITNRIKFYYFSNSYLKSTKEKFNYYRNGKLTPYEKEWERMFHANTSIDIFSGDEASNVFKGFGEDLGDLSKLNKTTLTKAYKKAALRLHPDQNAGEEMKAGENFKKLQNAYQSLLSLVQE